MIHNDSLKLALLHIEWNLEWLFPVNTWKTFCSFKKQQHINKCQLLAKTFLLLVSWAFVLTTYLSNGISRWRSQPILIFFLNYGNWCSLLCLRVKHLKVDWSILHKWKAITFVFFSIFFFESDLVKLGKYFIELHVKTVKKENSM